MLNSGSLQRYAVAIALAVVTLVGIYSWLPPTLDPNSPFPVDGTAAARSALREEGPRMDIAANYVGARALLHNGDPYAPLGEAFAEIGLDWPVAAPHTHPPTSYVFLIPLAELSYAHAMALWAALMIGCVAIAVWAMTDDIPLAIAAGPLLLFWPPIGWAIGQITIVWLAGLCLAWRWRHRPELAGVAIGVAAMPKMLPALLLVPFLLRGQWRVLLGFVPVVAAGVAVVVALDPGVIANYLETGREASDATIARLDNAALFPWLWHIHSWPGVVAGILLVAAVLWRGRMSWHSWAWAAVALLPIAWIYSLAPLGPGLVAAARSKGLAAGAFVFAAVALTATTRQYGDVSAGFQATAVILAGAALLAANLRDEPAGHDDAATEGDGRSSGETPHPSKDLPSTV